jgi:DNA-binding winged helix-turn-helix (wHTH) protein
LYKPDQLTSDWQEKLLTTQTLVFGPFRLLPRQRMLLEDDKPVRLGSRALDILITLAGQAGAILSKDELVSLVWPDTFVEEANLRVHIGALRKVLGDGRAGARYIENIPGRGYCFVAPVERLQNGSSDPTVLAPVTTPAHLPARLTRMIGRAETVATLVAQLPTRRFITLAGPGGIGKTTVALAVAESLAGAYRHGVRFVDLASLADARLAASALALRLDIAVPAADPLPALSGFLREKQMLLVLDNCEHVIGPVAVLAEEILKTAADVHILATSREPLRAAGESVHRLASLQSPPAEHSLSAAEALEYAAVQPAPASS